MRREVEWGARHFNRGEFFEAHEAWEHAWHRAGGEFRLYLQGLVQLAVGFHHARRHNMAGMRSTLARGLQKTERLGRWFPEADLADTLRAARECLRHNRPPARYPRIPLDGEKNSHGR